MIMTTHGKLGLAIAVVAILAMTGQMAVAATVAGQLGIAGFERVYDFESDPPLKLGDTDLDDNLTMDWHDEMNPQLWNVAGGYMSYDTTGIAEVDDRKVYSRSGATGESPSLQIWKADEFSMVDGYTIEIRMRINDLWTGEAALTLQAVAGNRFSSFDVWSDSITTALNAGGTSYDTADNDDGLFHTFRIVMEAGTGLVDLYRDGQIVVDSELAYSYSSGFVIIGNLGGYHASIDLDYIGLHSAGPYAPIRIPGDTNGDGDVDAADLAVVADNWGETADANDYTVGNFNDDTVVDAVDAAIQAAHWTGAGGEAAGVPEPSALIMLLALLPMWLARRRRA